MQEEIPQNYLKCLDGQILWYYKQEDYQPL